MPSNNPALRGDIQTKLKAAVREKFQDLIDDAEITQFVGEVTDQFKMDMKAHVTEILKEELRTYVQEYLKGKAHTHMNDNRTQYDIVVVQAIQKAIPEIFENLLGSMIQNAIYAASQSQRNY